MKDENLVIRVTPRTKAKLKMLVEIENEHEHDDDIKWNMSSIVDYLIRQAYSQYIALDVVRTNDYEKYLKQKEEKPKNPMPPIIM